MFKHLERLAAFAAILLALLSFGPAAHAADHPYLENTPPLLERITPDVLAAVFPDAERVALTEDDGPEAAAAYKGDEVIGYVFSTLDVIRARGYDATPFDIIAGVDLTGRVTGAVNLFQHEPMIVEDSQRTALMHEFLLDTAGMESRLGATNGPKPEFITGVTTSGRAFRNAIRDSARMVLGAREGRPVVTEPTLDIGSFSPRKPEDLLADGSIVSSTVTNADLARILDEAGAADLKLETEPRGGPEETYLELRVGLGTPMAIGRNATSAGAYERIYTDYPPGTQAIVLASNGRYDFQGFKFQNKSSGYKLERFRILQGDRVFEFDKDHYMRSGMAFGRISGVALLPPDSGFDPLAPWSVEVLVHGTDAAGEARTIALPALDYTLPEHYVLLPEAEPMPAWMEPWIDQWVEIAVLGAALVVLTILLATQSLWTRSRNAHRWLRNGFLVFTLLWLGWTVGGQLSILHLINYLKAPFQPMELGFYLAEPLIVIISVYTAISLVLLGRGVFCGWLCPFGALQELLAQISRALRLPQWNPSEKLQNKLWWGKYASLAAVIGIAFLVPTQGSMAAEVEPFKTAISSHFVRALPYVLYALALLSIGLFTERAYCRFLCPLGGALAILDRLHLLNLLKRRPECGNPCKLCERACPVRAIEASGKINMAECFQCLDCQVEYYDDKRCPPLAQERKQRERVGRGAPARRPALVVTRTASPKGAA